MDTNIYIYDLSPFSMVVWQLNALQKDNNQRSSNCGDALFGISAGDRTQMFYKATNSAFAQVFETECRQLLFVNDTNLEGPFVRSATL